MRNTKREALLDAMQAILDAAGDTLTDEQAANYDHLKGQVTAMDKAANDQPDGTPRPAPGPTVVTRKRAYVVAKAMGLAAGERGLDAGLEKEVADELSRTKTYKGIPVPLSALFTKSSDGQSGVVGTTTGGVLANTDRLLSDLLVDAEDAIRKLPVIGALGVTVVAVPSDAKVRIPRKTKGGTVGWIARDGTLTGVEDLEFDDITAEAHSLACGAKLNRSSLVYTNPAMQEIVRRDLAVAVEDALNNAYLNGTGTGNQPTGLYGALSLAGLNRSGAINASVTRRKYLDFTEYVASYSEASGPRKWLMHPTSYTVPQCTVAFSGATVPIASGDGTLVGFPVVQSHRAVHGTSGGDVPYAVFGSFDDTFLFQFGPAIDMMVNPFADSVFMSGSVLVRGIVDLDFAFRDLKKLALASDVAS